MFTKKLMTYIGVITAILSLIGGIWAFDAHYAKDEEVTEVKVRVAEVEIKAKENVEDLEIQIAGALQNQQMKSSVTFWQFQIEILENELKELRRQMRRYPEDQALREDYRDTLERKRGVQKKMEEAMQRIQ
jgi:hypothetical protein